MAHLSAHFLWDFLDNRNHTVNNFSCISLLSGGDALHCVELSAVHSAHWVQYFGSEPSKAQGLPALAACGAGARSDVPVAADLSAR